MNFLTNSNMYIYRVGKRGQVSGKKRVGANQQYKGMRAGEKEQKGKKRKKESQKL